MMLLEIETRLTFHTFPQNLSHLKQYMMSMANRCYRGFGSNAFWSIALPLGFEDILKQITHLGIL